MCYEKIVSAKYLGIQQSMDIEVDNINHVFYANGIATSNSHSYEYATNLIWSAYAKAHNPQVFLASYLFHANDKQKPREEIQELVSDSKRFNVNVVVPDLRYAKKHFSIINNNIMFGITDIKGIGTSQYDKVKECTKYIPSTWMYFLLNSASKLSEPCCRGLISVGALDYLKLPRIKMLYEYDKFIQLNDKEKEWASNNIHCCSPGLCCDYSDLADYISLIAPRKKTAKEKDGSRPFGGTHTDKRKNLLEGLVHSLKYPPYKLEDTPEWIASIEQQYLGVSITCQKIDACDISSANCTCKEFVDGRSGKLVLGVEINRMKEYVAKNGKPMAFLSVSDGTCSLDNVVVFSDAFSQFSHLLQAQNTVLLQGERDKKKGGFIVQRVVQV